MLRTRETKVNTGSLLNKEDQIRSQLQQRIIKLQLSKWGEPNGYPMLISSFFSNRKFHILTRHIATQLEKPYVPSSIPDNNEWHQAKGVCAAYCLCSQQENVLLSPSFGWDLALVVLSTTYSLSVSSDHLPAQTLTQERNLSSCLNTLTELFKCLHQNPT